MNTTHTTHIKDSYLDDKDFDMLTERIMEWMRNQHYSGDDFEEKYKDDMVELISDFISDFVEVEACDNFGWKYGAVASATRYYPTAENMYDNIKSKWIDDGMTQKQFDEACKYANSKLKDWEVEMALEEMDKFRCPLSMIGNVGQKLRESMEEWCIDNGLPEDSWEDYGDEEEVFFNNQSE